MVAAAPVIRRVRAKPWTAEFLTPQCPMNQEAKGGLLGPLPAYEFGSPVSWNAASMAAFTATAWCMIGASPA